MDNIIRQTTQMALHLVRPYVTPDAVVVDATCGNGHDTLALAEMGPARLFAFDVQEGAVRATTQLLEEHGYGKSIAEGRFTIAQLAHENLRANFMQNAGSGYGAASPLNVVVFNLGYLPGGDKSITTSTETTLAAVEGAMEQLAPDGLICITMYSGHAEGKLEKAALLDMAGRLDAGKWHTAYVSMPNQQYDPPEILLITRKQ